MNVRTRRAVHAVNLRLGYPLIEIVSPEEDSPALEWVHRVGATHYRRTRELPLEGWLRPVRVEQAAEACRRLGLKVRVARVKNRKTS